MERTKRWRATALVCSAVALGLLSGLSVYNGLGLTPKVEARAPHYTYCQPGEHYENWSTNVSNQYGGLNVNEQLHYRVNADCTWKAYQQSYASTAGGSAGGPPICCNNGPDLFQGTPGSPTYFDGAYFPCHDFMTNASATGSFAQNSATYALVQTQTYWYPDTGCSSYNTVLDSYIPANQP